MCDPFIGEYLWLILLSMIVAERLAKNRPLCETRRILHGQRSPDAKDKVAAKASVDANKRKTVYQSHVSIVASL